MHHHHYLTYWVNTLLPIMVAWGDWVYLAAFVVSILESLAFVGLVVPGSTITVILGALSEQGLVDFEALFFMVVLGGIAGDGASYFLGRKSKTIKSGEKLFNSETFKKGERFFERYGEKSVFFARFIGPIRPVVPFVAGLLGMDRRKFFFYNIVGALGSAFVYLGMGYLAGAAWVVFERWFGRVELVAVTFAVLIGLFFVIRKFYFKEKQIL